VTKKEKNVGLEIKFKKQAGQFREEMNCTSQPTRSSLILSRKRR